MAPGKSRRRRRMATGAKAWRRDSLGGGVVWQHAPRFARRMLLESESSSCCAHASGSVRVDFDIARFSKAWSLADSKRNGLHAVYMLGLGPRRRRQKGPSGKGFP